MDRDETTAKVIRLRPLRVLVVSEDDPFRAVNAMLISRRGCRVFSLSGAYAAAELVARERIDVVVVDGTARHRALLAELAVIADLVPPVGVVCVEEGTGKGSRPDSALEKWGPFEDLFAAIVRADRERARGRAAHSEDRLQPPGARAHGLD
ncbi:MAG TPA: hypothetical protein VMB05_00115 [Solirubrobacteraceae bacterium]|nr:hypothetical protein [Solirubrobacteraceae bacterium]